MHWLNTKAQLLSSPTYIYLQVSLWKQHGRAAGEKIFFYQHLILLEKIFSKKRKRKNIFFQNWEPGKYYLASLNFGGLEDTKSFNVSEKISS